MGCQGMAGVDRLNQEEDFSIRGGGGKSTSLTSNELPITRTCSNTQGAAG